MKSKRFRAYRALYLVEVYSCFTFIMMCFTGNLLPILGAFLIHYTAKSLKNKYRYEL